MVDVPKVVPWATWDEWREVRGLLYSPDPGCRQAGCGIAAAWRVRGKVPLSVETTAQLVEVALATSPPQIEQLALGMSVVRFVNGLIEPEQRKQCVEGEEEMIEGEEEMMDVTPCASDVRASVWSARIHYTHVHVFLNKGDTTCLPLSPSPLPPAPPSLPLPPSLFPSGMRCLSRPSRSGLGCRGGWWT